MASGGILVYAFPRAYSAGFSGFYLPLIMVLWLLILRGISIEFRSHQSHPLWRSFWDGAFAFSSILMAIFLGAALGNVIRGVPLESSGFFSGPLFTDFRTGPHPGVLDWYTVLVGVFTLLVLAGHGALYLAWKTNGEVRNRCRRIASNLWGGVALTGILTTIATSSVRPSLYSNLASRPMTWVLVAAMMVSLCALFVSLRGTSEAKPFFASCAFIATILAATAAGYYPNLLISTIDPANTLTISNAKAGELGMRVGLIWWTIAIILAIGYFAYLFRSFRGKVTLSEEGHGY